MQLDIKPILMEGGKLSLDDKIKQHQENKVKFCLNHDEIHSNQVIEEVDDDTQKSAKDDNGHEMKS